MTLKHLTRNRLDSLYRRYHRRDLVHPDPLVFLYKYEELRDREIAGLIASSLAYGRVSQIMRSVSSVLERMGGSPFLFLMNSTEEKFFSTYRDFRHRFTGGTDMANLLWAARSVIDQYGSLQACFAAGLTDTDDTVFPALSTFVGRLRFSLRDCRKGFLPSPEDGSACKRWNLYLRWMVRKDQVDPGGWDRIPRSKLVIPLDTHMHRIALALSLTRRRQADKKTALEITGSFSEMIPEDPVRYDFVLTRFGIRRDMDIREIQGAEAIYSRK